MPVEHDPVTQIVNVQWEEEGGAVFVAGGYAEFVLYCKVENKDDITDPKKKVEFTDLGDLDAFTIQDSEADTWPGANVTAGAYRKIVETDTSNPVAKPTFILGGNDAVQNPETLAFGSSAVIMVSHDGKNWTKAFRKQWPGHPENESAVYNFAIDGTSIYGNVGSVEWYYISGTGHEGQHEIQASKSYERLLKSSDGTSWSDAGQELRYDSGENWPNPPPPNITPPSLFMPHVNEKTNLPDGKFYYYEIKDDKGEIVESSLVKPAKYDSEWWLSPLIIVDKYGSSITITILKDGETTISTKSTPITYVTCVAYASGILMVGGMMANSRARIAASIDDGVTWKTVWTADKASYLTINTITAAPLSDLEEPTA